MDNVKSPEELGFLNSDEMQLYHDVCCDSQISYVPIADSDEFKSDYIEKMENQEENLGYKKSDFEEYIDHYNLRELFDSVKSLPMYDRLTEIYKYYANSYSIFRGISSFAKDKFKESAELFDGEKQIIYRRMFHKAKMNASVALNNMSYIEREVFYRLPDEFKNFANMQKEVQEQIDSLDNNRGGKKL